jgi:hypothetical protein
MLQQEVTALGEKFSVVGGVPTRNARAIEFAPLNPANPYEERSTSVQNGTHLDTLIQVVFVGSHGEYKGIFRYNATDSIDVIKSVKKKARDMFT